MGNKSSGRDEILVSGFEHLETIVASEKRISPQTFQAITETVTEIVGGVIDKSPKRRDKETRSAFSTVVQYFLQLGLEHAPDVEITGEFKEELLEAALFAYGHSAGDSSAKLYVDELGGREISDESQAVVLLDEYREITDAVKTLMESSDVQIEELGLDPLLAKEYIPLFTALRKLEPDQRAVALSNLTGIAKMLGSDKDSAVVAEAEAALPGVHEPAPDLEEAATSGEKTIKPGDVLGDFYNQKDIYNMKARRNLDSAKTEEEILRVALEYAVQSSNSHKGRSHDRHIRFVEHLLKVGDPEEVRSYIQENSNQKGLNYLLGKRPQTPVKKKT